MQRLASEIFSFISQNSETLIIQNPNEFIQSPFDYLFLPEKNLIIHCVSLNIEKKTPLFFQELSNFFAKKKIKTIHLWEDVWQSKQEIVKSRLLSLLGKSQTIPARLTQVRRIDKPIADNFLIDNHLQGTVGAKLKYGLFLPERYFRVIDLNTNIIPENSEELLVAVASFSNAKKILREGQEFRSYEMIRFANLKGFTVVGGLNKLLKNFIREQNPDDIMTYSDSDWSDGSNYEKIGFERIEQTAPLTFILDSQTFTRKMVSTPHPRPLSFEDRGVIYNSGNWKFLMKLKHD